jgi:hypothetical protein
VYNCDEDAAAFLKYVSPCKKAELERKVDTLSVWEMSPSETPEWQTDFERERDEF